MSTEFLERVRRDIGPNYDIERELGAGGTAVVFLGRDRKHERPVALKVLRPQIAATIGAERFLREIRVAARLAHPHILPLLDSGEVEGLPYYVMPFVDGESLADRLRREGRLTVSAAVALVRDVADALDYAHAVGIVHRDIKPDNILLLGGHAVVADFGIARAMHSAAEGEGEAEATQVGIAVGTPAYMSPEQAAGESSIDGRSDLYSLAAVLYEMLIGAPPFVGPTAQTIIAKRFSEIPKRLRALREDVPTQIDDAVARALSLEPEFRHPTAGHFARALSEPTPSMTTSSGSVILRLTSEFAGGAMPSVAVMPFANLTNDPENEYLCDGITEEIIGMLSKLRTLRVAARTSSFAFKGTRQEATVVGERLKVANILDGSVRRAGNRIRVSAQLVNIADGHHLWSDRFDRELDDVFQIQDEIGSAIAETLQTTLLGEAAPVLVAERSTDPDAYKAYLKGRFFLNKRTEEDLHRAVEHFEQAAGQDADFALAHSGLADALTVLGIYGAMPATDAMPLARAAATRALKIDPTLAPAHATIGVVRAVFDWDWPAASQSFKRAIAISPRYPTAHQWYAINYLVPQRRFVDAVREIEVARTLDPLSLAIGATAGVIRYFAGDYTAAAAEQRRVLDVAPDFAISHYFLASVCREMGDAEGARRGFETAIELSGGTPEMLAGAAQAAVKRGDVDSARRSLDGLLAQQTKRYVSPAVIAQVYLALDDRERAIEWLLKAAEVRDPELTYLALRPVYAPLVKEPRYQALCARVGVHG